MLERSPRIPISHCLGSWCLACLVMSGTNNKWLAKQGVTLILFSSREDRQDSKDKWRQTPGPALLTVLEFVTSCPWSVHCHRNSSCAACHPELPWREQTVSKLLCVDANYIHTLPSPHVLCWDSYTCWVLGGGGQGCINRVNSTQSGSLVDGESPCCGGRLEGWVVPVPGRTGPPGSLVATLW